MSQLETSIFAGFPIAMFDDTGGSFGGKKSGRTDDLELCRQMRVAPSFPLLQSWSQSGQTLLNGRGRGKMKILVLESVLQYVDRYIFSTFKVGSFGNSLGENRTIGQQIQQLL